MPEPDLVEIFAAPLHLSRARYLVAGSVGTMIYSEPRLTINIDLAPEPSASFAAPPAARAKKTGGPERSRRSCDCVRVAGD